MRVAVDATAIPGQRLGVGVYVTELLRHIGSDVDLHVFVKATDLRGWSEALGRTTLHPARIHDRVARIAWMNTILPLRLRRIAPDVFWGPHYELPPGMRCPGVVTFHDPTFFTLPDVHERAKVEYFTRMARVGISRSSRVIAVSEYAKRGAIEHAGADPMHTHVVYEGIDLERYRPSADPSPYEKPYVFFVGALAPHKDVPGLIEAFDALDVTHDLVIAGPRAWGAAAVDAAIGSARKKDAIHCVGYIPEEEKIRRLQHADAFVFPSIAEGFGVPVLEAMACGAPVITTTGSAPEEFASGAARLVGPNDAGALRQALLEVLTDADLAASLRRLGPRRAGDFGWEIAAGRTVEVWREAAA
jgi:glycosyltransferase involved in cell wall biosynthesis